MTNIKELEHQATEETETEETQEADEGGVQTGTQAGSQPDPRVFTSESPKTVILTEYLSEQVPGKLRTATYNTIVAAIESGDLLGLVHKTQKGLMNITTANGKDMERPFAQVILKNGPDLQKTLDELCIRAINAELVRTAGRSMTIEEMIDMGDALDFEALCVAGRKEQEKRSEETRRRNQNRLKKRPVPTTVKKAKA